MRIRVHRGLVYSKQKALPSYPKVNIIVACIRNIRAAEGKVVSRNGPESLCDIEGRKPIHRFPGRIYYVHLYGTSYETYTQAMHATLWRSSVLCSNLFFRGDRLDTLRARLAGGETEYILNSSRETFSVID